MASSDMRYYETLYGIHIDKWTVDFGGYFSDHSNLLVKEYISEGCSTTTSSSATETLEFIYPHHIKKKYFIEGVIQGHITVAASNATATITKYRVSIYKIHESSGENTSLFTTGWITVNDTLDWDSSYGIGEEAVYPFWIDAWEKATLDENERFYIKIEVADDGNAVIWHSNDSSWEDIKIEIPLIM